MSKRNILLIFLIFSLFFTSCKKDVKQISTISSSSDGWLLMCSSSSGHMLTNSAKDSSATGVVEDSLPHCKPLDLKDTEVLLLEDQVVNCHYEEGHLRYLTIGRGSRPWKAFELYKDYINWPKYNIDYKTQQKVCALPEGWFVYAPWDEYSSFMAFLEKYAIKEKGLLSLVVDDKDVDKEAQFFYRCEEPTLCEQLRRTSRWTSGDHYFLYGSRGSDNDQEYILIDDKLFSWGNIKRLAEEEYPSWLVEEGIRNVVKFKWNKLIVNKYTEGELYEPYRSDPWLLDPISPPWKVVGKFKIKTCEINL